MSDRPDGQRDGGPDVAGGVETTNRDAAVVLVGVRLAVASGLAEYRFGETVRQVRVSRPCSSPSPVAPR